MAGLIVALQILFVQQLTEDSKAMLTKYLFPFILVQRKVKEPLLQNVSFSRLHRSGFALIKKKSMTGDRMCIPITLNYLQKERKFSIR